MGKSAKTTGAGVKKVRVTTSMSSSVLGREVQAPRRCRQTSRGDHSSRLCCACGLFADCFRLTDFSRVQANSFRMQERVSISLMLLCATLSMAFHHRWLNATIFDLKCLAWPTRPEETGAGCEKNIPV